MSQLLRAIREGPTARATPEDIFRWILRGTLIFPLLLLAALVPLQPALWQRIVFACASVMVVAAVAGGLARWRSIQSGSWALVLGLIAIIGGLATVSGGIESPGVRSYLVLVLITGVLLGQIAAIGVAILCAAITLGLALAANADLLPSAAPYAPLTLWILLCMYLCLTLVVMELFSRSVVGMLDRTAEALKERARALDRLEAVLSVSEVGVWRYDPKRRCFQGDDRIHDVMTTDATATPDVPETQWLSRVHPEDLAAVRGALDAASLHGQESRLEVRVRGEGDAWRYLEVTYLADPESRSAPHDVTGLVLDRSAHRHAEIARAHASWQLGERVKELRLLHDAALLLRPDHVFDPTVLSSFAALVPAAFQDPTHTGARVTYGALSSATAHFEPSERSLDVDIRTSVGTGTITVVRTGPRPSDGKAEFLPEERQLLLTLADMLSAYLERDHAERHRDRLEQQLRQAGKMEALGTLAGGIAHDFNNVLAAIGANLMVVRSMIPNAHDATAPLEEVERAHERARNLVRRILMFGKLDATERKIVGVDAMVRDVGELVKSLIPSGVSLEIAMPADLPSINADEVQVHQAVLNLMTNAGFAMRGRRGSVRVTARTVQMHEGESATAYGLAPGHYVRLGVADDGAGIDPAIKDRLFDPFFTTKGEEGTGLGLAVVYRVMQEHGGTVTVHSTLDVGTEFALYFPAASTSDAPAPSDASRIVRGRGERILLVDDEAVLCFALARLLRSVGFECESYSDPHEAAAAFRSDPDRFAVALVDFSMPGISGVELAEELTKIRPHFPVVLSSGYSAVGGGDQQAGIAAILPKPVALAQLTQALAPLLAARHEKTSPAK
jgi:signal transduction histidine kinase/ActR/RegA family two-component response regulator/PAS domain-containing protein